MKSFDLILKSSFIVFLGIILSRVLGYFFRIIVARHDMEIYGSYIFALFSSQFILPFIMLGLGSGLLRYMGYYQGKKRDYKVDLGITSALKVVFTLSLILCAIFYYFSPDIALFFNKPSALPFLKAFAFLIPISAFTNLFSVILRAHHKITSYIFATNILVGILEIIFLLIFFRPGFIEEGLIISILASSFIALIFLIFFSRSLFIFRYQKFDREVIDFSLPLLPGSFLFSFITLTDTLILGYFASVKDVALYNVALPTSQIILVFLTAFLTVFLPIISNKYALKKDFTKDYKFVIKWISLLTFPFLLSIMLFRSEVIRVLFGEDYVLASGPLVLLTLSYFFYCFSAPAGNVLTMLNRTREAFWVAFGTFSINLILNLILIPLSVNYLGTGVHGAALATTISLLFLAVTTFLLIYKYSTLKLFYNFHPKILFAGLVSTFFVYLINKYIFSADGFIALVIAYLIFIAIYLILIFFVGLIDKKDISLIISFFKLFKKN